MGTAITLILAIMMISQQSSEISIRDLWNVGIVGSMDIMLMIVGKLIAFNFNNPKLYAITVILQVIKVPHVGRKKVIISHKLCVLTVIHQAIKVPHAGRNQIVTDKILMQVIRKNTINIIRITMMMMMIDASNVVREVIGQMIVGHDIES